MRATTRHTHATPPSRSGFSLVEILISLLIIAALAAVSIPNALNARITGNDNTAKVILGNLASGQEDYRATFNTYFPKDTQVGPDESLTYEPNTPGGEFLPNISKPIAYHVYFTALTHAASASERYCIAVQQHRGQSNAFLWTSGTAGEYQRINRDTITDFETDMSAACATAIDY